jgi:hypothetical protein
MQPVPPSARVRSCRAMNDPWGECTRLSFDELCQPH